MSAMTFLEQLRRLELCSYKSQPRYIKRDKEWVPNPDHPPEASWHSLIEWAEKRNMACSEIEH